MTFFVFATSSRTGRTCFCLAETVSNGGREGRERVCNRRSNLVFYQVEKTVFVLNQAHLPFLQDYSISGHGGYVVNITKSTPDAPYGGTFRTRVQVCVFPGLEDPVGTARVRVSYEPDFLQTTSLRGVIEKGMAQGMKETYQLFQDVSYKVLLVYFAPFVPSRCFVYEIFSYGLRLRYRTIHAASSFDVLWSYRMVKADCTVCTLALSG